MTVDALLTLFTAGTPSLDATLADLDERARTFQRRYRRVVQEAVWGGFLSLVFPFAAISFGPSGWFVFGEALSLAIMLAGIGEGSLWRYHEHWVLERHRAERLRLARFAFLIDPRHWTLPPGVEPMSPAELSREVQETTAIGEAEMKRWLRDARWPDVTVPDEPVDAGFLTELRRYYLSHRLNDQLAYFVDMADRRERLDAITRVLPAAGFGIAIVLSAVLLWNELTGGPAPATEAEAHGGWLLFSILVLPTAGTAARLLRTAFEFARNRQRFSVTAAELERTRGRLESVTDPRRVAWALARAEFALENEHRAWLLLMREAEWFG